ncbi:hypothetical protein DD904_01880 [Staphylococcus pseudintermedius]|nr:hypothetical protein [Staphylococcus pseudintermedius]EGQ2906014.1 hypothetical protein [Staphylococcus pseudintermedius]EGQ4405340.1 hypothetical protein [Staphylococcus pseudintermedius]EGQ4409575.1 hypothetical protein [Staphylococcus pseudintermedius]PWZ82001.1 hypothetical protein DD904_01880 [Staphylococcus pseudintermedius]
MTCLSLTVPTTKPVTDFYRQGVTHAGRTRKNKRLIIQQAFYFLDIEDERKDKNDTHRLV